MNKNWIIEKNLILFVTKRMKDLDNQMQFIIEAKRIERKKVSSKTILFFVQST